SNPDCTPQAFSGWFFCVVSCFLPIVYVTFKKGCHFRVILGGPVGLTGLPEEKADNFSSLNTEKVFFLGECACGD
ncbi:MAG: hypothetical protein ACK5EA_18130, partial [Planctomycetaceae bacterium]